MKWRESLKSVTNKSRGTVLAVKSLFGEGKIKNWLRERGVLTKVWGSSAVNESGIVENKTDYETLKLVYEKVPKVFRSINMRVAFAVQGGFKLAGDEADIEKINKWRENVYLDNMLLPTGRGSLKNGDTYIELIGEGENLRLPFLPTKQMRVKRKQVEKDGKTYFTHETESYVQMDGTTVLNEWKPEDIAHFRWNWDGVSAYGLSEIKPGLSVITDKLDMEAVIPRIGKFLYPKVIYRCGRPDNPFNQGQLNDFKASLEDMVVGGDVIVSGDIEPVVVQPMSGAESIVRLLDHIEQQVDLCLNNPTNLVVQGKTGAQEEIFVVDYLDVKTIQDMMAMEIQQKIFPRILGKRDVPKIKWNPPNTEAFLRLSRTLRQMVGKKQERMILTPDECREIAGYGPIDEEVVQKIADMEKPTPMFGGGGNEPKKKIQPDGKKDGKQ